MNTTKVSPQANSQTPWREIMAIVGCLATYGVTLSFMIPLLSLILESRGVDKTTIGALAACSSLGTLLFSIAIPSILARFNTRRFLVACILIEAVLTISLYIFDNLIAWFAMRFVMGATGAGLFIASETWINQLADEASRGRVIGVYASVLGVTFAIGPVMISVLGIEGPLPFIAGSLVIFTAIVPLLFIQSGANRSAEHSRFNALSFVLVAPIISAAVLLTAFKETIGFSLLAVFGLENGMSEGRAALMLAVLSAGSVAMQWPIGWLADHINRFHVLLMCAGVGLAGSVALPFVIGAGTLFWALLFFWGGIFSGMYTVAMTLAGQHFKGRELATANASFGVLWGIGSFVGPITAGAAMDYSGTNGFVAVLVAGSVLFFMLVLLRRGASTRI